MDYTSHLYSPNSGGNLMRMESLLESFTSKISGLQHVNYWERLVQLKMDSVTRRF